MVNNKTNTNINENYEDHIEEAKLSEEQEEKELRALKQEDPFLYRHYLLKEERESVKENQIQIAEQLKEKFLNKEQEIQKLEVSLPYHLKPYTEEIYYYNLFDTSLITPLIEDSDASSFNEVKAWYIWYMMKQYPESREWRLNTVVMGYIKTGSDMYATVDYVNHTMLDTYANRLDSLDLSGTNTDQQNFVKRMRREIENFETNPQEKFRIPKIAIGVYSRNVPKRYRLYKNWTQT